MSMVLLSQLYSKCQSSPIHLMNADSAPCGHQPWSQLANEHGLWFCLQDATNHARHRHVLLLCSQLILILQFYERCGKLSQPMLCSKNARPGIFQWVLSTVGLNLAISYTALRHTTTWLLHGNDIVLITHLYFIFCSCILKAPSCKTTRSDHTY